MKINLIDKAETKFYQISIGEIFTRDDTAFMKIDEVTVFGEPGHRYNAIKLEDYCLYFFENTDIVKPAKAEITVTR